MADYDASVRVKADVNAKNLQELEKEFDRLNKKLDTLYKKGDKLEALGVDKQSRQWRNLVYDVAQVEGDLYEISERIKELNTVEKKDAFECMHQNVKECVKETQVMSKSSGSLFDMLKKRIKGITLSLLVFNQIRKAFNAMISAAKEGFDNLAQYSGDYNKAMSEMKSESVELKNNLAAAFEPIVTTAIPYITQLISWLSVAAESMSRFLAVISGKNSYTKAKKQAIDYAKTIQTAGDSAKGALAAFDSINVLSSGSTTGGGEATGADAFETVEITEADYEWLDMVKDKLYEIIGLLMGVGIAMAVFGLGGPMFTFVAALTLVLGLLEFIVQYMDAWANGISMDNLNGMLQGLLAVFFAIYALFGPVAAGFTLLAGGVALVVLAIKDMLENGVNAQNYLTFLMEVVAGLIAVFMLFGSTAALIVAGVLLVISTFAKLIAIAGNGEEAIAALKSMCKNFADFFKKIFAGDMEGAMESLKAAGKDVVNVLIIAAESLVNCIIKGLNWLIEKINSISFEVPEWVPIIGGKKLGFDLQPVQEAHLPRLATGGITNGPTRAVIGEAGREAVLPLENNTGWMDELADRLAEKIPSGGNGPVYLQIDGKTFARLQMPYLNQEKSRVGVTYKI